jgi:subtilisin family serine protease
LSFELKSQEITLMTKKEGTSMASPLVAAAATLVRQFYQQGFYPTGIATKNNEFAPSAALVKANLIHSAQLLDGYISLVKTFVVEFGLQGRSTFSIDYTIHARIW